MKKSLMIALIAAVVAVRFLFTKEADAGSIAALKDGLTEHGLLHRVGVERRPTLWHVQTVPYINCVPRHPLFLIHIHTPMGTKNAIHLGPDLLLPPSVLFFHVATLAQDL